MELAELLREVPLHASLHSQIVITATLLPDFPMTQEPAAKYGSHYFVTGSLRTLSQATFGNHVLC